MGGRQIRPATIWKTKNLQLGSQILKAHPVERPPWFDVLASCPPGESLVRPVPTQHVETRPSKKQRKPKNIYKPQRLEYPEDKLRRTFFMDHPWELARPRNLVEQDGKDYQLVDWSKGLRQQSVPLTGESVVQRQLWLMENKAISPKDAYEQVRREFYRLRQEEQIERRIAEEEARYVGAYFGKTRQEIGMQLENNEFENWKIWAGKQNQEAQLQKSQESAQDSYDEEDTSSLGTAAEESEASGRPDELGQSQEGQQTQQAPQAQSVPVGQF